MPGFYSDAEPPLYNGSGFVINPSIWSDNGDHGQNYLQGSQAQSQQQPNVSASAMQQLAFDLSVFSLNSHQRYLDDGGSPIDYDSLEHRFKSGSDIVPISASTAALIAAAAAAVNGVDEDGENQLGLLARRRSQNTTECVPVPSSEHVAEIVGRQGCKIKALRAKTNTYIKTPVRGEEPVFVVTGRRDDVDAAKREILSAADHFTQIRASRRHSQGGAPAPGHITAYVRVPYKVVGLVVGPKGATIKRIQQQTHTYIITPSREKDPTFEVTGLPENVEAARKEIETHIANRTGVYPATTIGAPQSQSFDDDASDGRQRAGILLANDFHLNGVDTTLNNSDSATPDSTPTNGASLYSIDTRRDSVNSITAPPYFSSSTRALSLSSACNPFSATTAIVERRASADAYFLGNGYNNGDATAALGTQQFNNANGWCTFVSGGATNKSQGLPIFAANNANTANNNKSATTRFNLAYSHSGSDQDEGVWSVGGESPNSLTVEPLSSCLGSIWSEVVGV